MRKSRASFQPQLGKLPPQFASIEDLLAACLKVDEGAWRVFIHVFNSNICAGVRARVGRVRPEWACLVEEDDLAGMIYCELRRGNFSALRRPITRAKIVNYFVSVLSHDILDALRRLERHEILVHDLLCEMQPPARPDEVAMQHERNDRLNEALNTLSPQEQAMIKMYYIQRMEYKEIAEKLGLGLGTVCKKFKRLRDKLRHIPLLRELQKLER